MHRVVKVVKNNSEVVALVLLSLVAYGLFIPWLGLYWDDWTYLWAFKSYGHAGLFDYFSTNRPVYGLLYHISLPIIGENVLLWHIFGLFWRIIATLTFYWLIKLLSPNKNRLPFIAGMLFAVYPGFLLQPITITFGHFWIMYSVFLLSLCFTVIALHQQKRKTLFTILACFLSLFNVLGMEYFLPLEIIRFVLIFYTFDYSRRFGERVWLAFKRWIPYLLILMGVTAYRAFFFSGQTELYSLSMLDAFKQGFGLGMTQLLSEVLSALYQTVIFAWVQPFIAMAKQFGTSKVYLVVIAVSFLVFVVGFLFSTKHLKSHVEKVKSTGSPWVIAVTALLVAGIPFYITNLHVRAEALYSRFTLPFMFGAVLLLALLLDTIPWAYVRAISLSVLLAGSVGFHLINANNFRLMTNENNQLFYQLAWRAPSLKPNTLIVTNEENLYFTFVALRSEINSVYPHTEGTNYSWIYGRDLNKIVRLPLQENTEILMPYLVQDFSASSNAIAVFQLNGNGCLRFLDSDSLYLPTDIGDYQFQTISNASVIQFDPDFQVQLDAALIGTEPAHDWCYYFEKGDLAIQLGDFQTAIHLYGEAQSKSLKPHEGYELIPFIKSYALAGDWDTTSSLINEAIETSPESDDLQPSLCSLVESIADQQPGSEVNDILLSLNCTSNYKP
mgnify:CR=1 FL=1